MWDIIQIVNFMLIIILAALMIKNNDLDNQKLPRVLFVIVICLFVVSIIFF